MLAALGHLHEDTPHTERAELVCDRAIRAAASSVFAIKSPFLVLYSP
jgi:hypothetical protein